MAEEGNTVDLLSQLTEPIIHHILSFLPTEDAAKTSVLSKMLRSTWNSFPMIVFKEEFFRDLPMWFDEHRLDMILESVLGSLMRHSPEVSLEKFVFHVNLTYGRMITDEVVYDEFRLDRALGFAISNKAKELDLDTCLYPAIYYNLPPFVFSAESVRVLKLRGCNLKLSSSTLSCPSIEHLNLEECKGPEQLKISGNRLKRLKLRHYDGSNEIDIVAPNLEKFTYYYPQVSLLSREPEQFQLNFSSCKSLKYLSLESRMVNNEWLRSHLQDFPLLEKLKLSIRSDVSRIYVKNASLKTIELKGCAAMSYVKVSTLNLESFIYKGMSDPCDIDITACKFLRRLNLHGANVTDEWLENIIPQFSYLESVKLFGCQQLKKFNIFHKQLKSIELVECDNMREIQIYTPRLSSFTSDLLLSPPSIYAPHVDAKLCLQNHFGITTNEWFIYLRNFLTSFDHCEVLSLFFICDTDVIFPKELMDNLLPPSIDIKHLKVEIISTSTCPKKLVDSLLWISLRPKTITIVSINNRIMLLKFQYCKARIIEEEDQLCCKGRPRKCWKHYLSKLTMKNFEDVDQKLLSSFFKENAIRLKSIDINDSS